VRVWRAPGCAAPRVGVDDVTHAPPTARRARRPGRLGARGAPRGVHRCICSCEECVVVSIAGLVWWAACSSQWAGAPITCGARRQLVTTSDMRDSWARLTGGALRCAQKPSNGPSSEPL
jgi:hypothetical protein